jgi:hypothetical protein
MLPQFLKDKTIAVFDIEADRIPSTKIYCISVLILKNNKIIDKVKAYTTYWTPYSNGSLFQAITAINNCDYNCGHNIVNYDIPAITRILNLNITSKPLDTLIIASIMYSYDDLYAIDTKLGIDSNLVGALSLKAFGQRLGSAKIEFEDFEKLSEEMVIYCNQDVELTAKLLNLLLSRDNFPLEQVIEVEHQTARVVTEQTQQGFYLDIEKATALNTELLKEKLELSQALRKVFLPKFLKDGKEKTYKKLSKGRRFLPNTDYIPLLGTK